MVKSFPGGNRPEENYPGWEFSGVELSEWQLSSPSGSYPGWKLSLVGVFWMGIIR